MEGSKCGQLDIKAHEIDDSLFDYVFLGQKGCKIDLNKLEILRKEFLYWYPMDLFNH